MIIYEQIKYLLRNKIEMIVSSAEVKDKLFAKFVTKPDSIILSDYCYNRINNGIPFNKHIFKYINRGEYKYLGEDYPYTGFIYHRPKGQKEDIIVGEWNNGIKILYEKTDDKP